MTEYKYDIRLATGAIASGSTIGGLIPPSLAFIVYGVTVEQSIGRLFMAGILPGVLVTLTLIVLVTVLCSMNPTLGPPAPASTFREKVTSVRFSWPVLLLIVIVLGGIYGGFFTPTEAGAVGALGSLVIGLAMHRLPFRGSFDHAIGAVQMAGMIFFMMIYATAFAQFFAVTQLPIGLAKYITGLTVSKYITLTGILLLYFVLGFVLPSMPVIVLTMPIIFPAVTALGFDPIWFGVLMILLSQVALLTPPIGMTVFAMSGVTNVPMYTIFRGVIPYWIVLLAVTVVLIAFPQISLVLPNLVFGS
jgi:tripartite ATP-independent transporter DctM subunit